MKPSAWALGSVFTVFVDIPAALASFDLLSELRQSAGLGALMGAGVGFASLAAATLLAAWLQRRQTRQEYERSIAREEQMRLEKVASLAISLQAEIRSELVGYCYFFVNTTNFSIHRQEQFARFEQWVYENAKLRNIDHIINENRQLDYYYRLFIDERGVYEANTGNVGALGAELSSQVVACYGGLALARTHRQSGRLPTRSILSAHLNAAARCFLVLRLLGEISGENAWP